MARAFVICLALLATACASAGAASVSHGPPAGGAPLTARDGTGFVPDEVIVRFRAGATRLARASAYRRGAASASRRLRAPGIRVLRLRSGVRLQAAIAALERDPAVAYAQPNHRYRLAGVPNDPRFGELWGLRNIGQGVDGSAGSPGADVDAVDAWNQTTGTTRTVVAVADSGIAYDHPDLAPNLWTNRGETGGGRESNGRDDDRDGLVDDLRGWDFVDRDPDPRDLNGHGTHVAGIIGARGNNGFGTAGVNWRVGLMNLRVADAAGIVTDTAIIDAFDYAASKGARVVNASFVSPSYSAALRDSIRRHPRTLFVAAAGNGDENGAGSDNDRTPQYPCSFALVNLICVAASDQSDRLTGFSNFGHTSVDVAAPGINVLSSAPAYDPLFADGFETELAGKWVTGGVNDGWARITTVAHGGAYSLSDSPGTMYQNDTDSFVRTASPLNLGGRGGCRVEYALRLSTEPGVDRLLMEVSPDGVGWTTVSESSGSSEGRFLQLVDDISPYDGAPVLYVRFRLVTNGSVTADGAQLDDVSVRCLGSHYTGSEVAFNDGTSMAAPHVSGTAALVLSRYPRLGVKAVRLALLRGVDRLPSLAGRVASGGRLSAFGALRQARRLLPSLRLFGASRQRAGKGSVALFARCKSSCSVELAGRVTIGGSSVTGGRLKRTARALRAHRRKRLVVRLTGGARAHVGRALAHHRRVTAIVTVTATDRRGSLVRKTRKVRLR